MVSLYIFAVGRLTLLRAIAVGALVGLAGMMTAKSVFYAPCFAGLAWWRYERDGGHMKFLAHLVVIFAAAAVSFGFIYTAHKSGLSERSEEHTSELHSLMRISYAVL